MKQASSSKKRLPDNIYGLTDKEVMEKLFSKKLIKALHKILDEKPKRKSSKKKDS